MTSYNFTLIFGVVLAVVGIPKISGCADKLTECMKNYQEGNNDHKSCKAAKKAQQCLEGVKDSCDESSKAAVQTALDQINDYLEKCNPGDGFDGAQHKKGVVEAVTQHFEDGCKKRDYESCLKKAIKDNICPFYICVNQLKEKCQGRGLSELSEAIAEKYKHAEERCGCVNLQPSALALLAIAAVLALRSYF